MCMTRINFYVRTRYQCNVRVKDSIHLWEMEMKILLSDTRFDADDLRFVLVLEGQFTCKPESRSQKVEL